MMNYIGINYVLGGEDENGLDCYSFVRYWLRKEKGIKLPPVYMDNRNLLSYAREFQNNKSLSLFKKVEHPVDGTVVMISRSKIPCHTGIWIDGGILHCLEDVGVVFTPLDKLNLLCLKVEGYYEYVG